MTTLADVCELVAGYAFKSNDFGEYPDKVVKIKDIQPPFVNFSELQGVNLSCYNKEKLEKYIVSDGDFVVAMTGATIGKIGKILHGKAYINQRVLVFRPKEEKCDSKFIYYVLMSDDFLPYINNHIDSESVQPNISATSIGKYSFWLPPISYQRKIANILSSIDEKIELNILINRNLEHQARVYYYQWLQEKQEKIKWKDLGEVAYFNQRTYSLKENWPFVNYLDTAGITRNTISSIQYIDLKNEELPSRARRKLSNGDILFSTVRPNQRHYGMILNPTKNMLVSTGFAVISSKTCLVSNELIYLCLTTDSFIEKMQRQAEQNTSTYPSIRPNEIMVCQIPISTDDNMDKINTLLKMLFLSVATRQNENNRLATLRDTLLPKLLSGEIDVSEVEV